MNRQHLNLSDRNCGVSSKLTLNLPSVWFLLICKSSVMSTIISQQNLRNNLSFCLSLTTYLLNFIMNFKLYQIDVKSAFWMGFYKSFVSHFSRDASENDYVTEVNIEFTSAQLRLATVRILCLCSWYFIVQSFNFQPLA